MAETNIAALLEPNVFQQLLQARKFFQKSSENCPEFFTDPNFYSCLSRTIIKSYMETDKYFRSGEDFLSAFWWAHEIWGKFCKDFSFYINKEIQSFTYDAKKKLQNSIDKVTVEHSINDQALMSELPFLAINLVTLGLAGFASGIIKGGSKLLGLGANKLASVAFDVTGSVIDEKIKDSMKYSADGQNLDIARPWSAEEMGLIKYNLPPARKERHQTLSAAMGLEYDEEKDRLAYIKEQRESGLIINFDRVLNYAPYISVITSSGNTAKYGRKVYDQGKMLNFLKGKCTEIVNKMIQDQRKLHGYLSREMEEKGRFYEEAVYNSLNISYNDRELYLNNMKKDVSYFSFVKKTALSIIRSFLAKNGFLIPDFQ